MKRDYLFLLASPLVILSGCPKQEKPNVILFLVDDLGWTDLASYGSDIYQVQMLISLSLKVCCLQMNIRAARYVLLQEQVL
jgi:hypothetical protein